LQFAKVFAARNCESRFPSSPHYPSILPPAHPPARHQSISLVQFLVQALLPLSRMRPGPPFPVPNQPPPPVAASGGASAPALRRPALAALFAVLRTLAEACCAATAATASATPAAAAAVEAVADMPTAARGAPGAAASSAPSSLVFQALLTWGVDTLRRAVATTAVSAGAPEPQVAAMLTNSLWRAEKLMCYTMPFSGGGARYRGSWLACSCRSRSPGASGRSSFQL
jgi:hypothetical protein